MLSTCGFCNPPNKDLQFIIRPSRHSRNSGRMGETIKCFAMLGLLCVVLMPAGFAVACAQLLRTTRLRDIHKHGGAAVGGVGR